MEIVSGLTVPAYLLRAGPDGYREEREGASGVDGGEAEVWVAPRTMRP